MKQLNQLRDVFLFIIWIILMAFITIHAILCHLIKQTQIPVPLKATTTKVGKSISFISSK